MSDDSSFQLSDFSFLLGTGYHERSTSERDFAYTWYRNIRRYSPQVDKIICITTGCRYPLFCSDGVQWIRGENLGHIGDLLISDLRSPTSELCGWSASVLALCLIAYNCKRDLVYLEQDCLAFGPWLEAAYIDLADRGMVFGQKHETEPWMPCSQSLFIIRHRFLLEFVRRYLSLPPDRDINPENKFVEMEKQGDFARLSFGVDRTRPIPWEAPVFYAQRWTDDELTEAQSRGLL